ADPARRAPAQRGAPQAGRACRGRRGGSEGRLARGCVEGSERPLVGRAAGRLGVGPWPLGTPPDADGGRPAHGCRPAERPCSERLPLRRRAAAVRAGIGIPRSREPEERRREPACGARYRHRQAALQAPGHRRSDHRDAAARLHGGAGDRLSADLDRHHLVDHHGVRVPLADPAPLTMADHVVRPVVLEDAEAFVTAYERAWDATLAPIAGRRLGELSPFDERVAGFRTTFAQPPPGAGVWVAERDREIVGVAVRVGSELRALFVVPEAWGTGVAGALMDVALDAMRADG